MSDQINKIEMVAYFKATIEKIETCKSRSVESNGIMADQSQDLVNLLDSLKTMLWGLEQSNSFIWFTLKSKNERND